MEGFYKVRKEDKWQPVEGEALVPEAEKAVHPVAVDRRVEAEGHRDEASRRWIRRLAGE